jgi:uncharacterized membrane protein HdeD (DUF308 family)
VNSDDQPTPPTSPKQDHRSRRWVLLRRLLLSAFAGGLLGFSLLTTDTRAFWDGALIGVGTQLLLRGLVGLLLRGRQDSLWGAVLSVAAGLAVGALVAYLTATEQLLSMTVVGGLVGVVDVLVSWVIFPSGNRTPSSVEEPTNHIDADLHDGFAQDDDELS